MSRSNSRSNKKESKILLIAVLGVILAAMILLMPKEPVVMAVNASGGNSDAAGLIFSEIMSDNASALPDENGAFSDWLEVWNPTDHAIDLKNVGLSNRSDKIQFLFPEMIILSER